MLSSVLQTATIEIPKRRRLREKSLSFHVSTCVSECILELLLEELLAHKLFVTIFTAQMLLLPTNLKKPDK